MSKIGVGVGEEFPVDEPPPAKPDPAREAALDERRRHWRVHHYLHIATRLAIIALIVAAIVWMFVPHPQVAASISGAGYPYHRHFFFPFFPLLLILLFALAWRRRGWRHHHHWHHHRDGGRNGEA